MCVQSPSYCTSRVLVELIVYFKIYTVYLGGACCFTCFKRAILHSLAAACNKDPISWTLGGGHGGAACRQHPRPDGDEGSLRPRWRRDLPRHPRLGWDVDSLKSEMKLSELHKIALEKGADPAALDNALDSDNPRDAINAVIRSLGDSPRRLRVHAAGSPRRRPGRGSPRKGFNRYDPTTRTYTVAGIGDKAVWQKFLLCHMISSPRSGIISKEEDAAWGACKGSDGRLEYFNTVTGTTVREPPAAAMSPMTRARAAAAAKDQTAGATGMASEFFNVDVDENLRKFYEDNGVQSFEGVLAKLGVMNLRDLDEVSDELFDSVPGLTIIHRKRIRRELPKVLEVAGEAGKYRAVGAISTEQSDGRMRSAMRNFVASHSERVHKLEAELGFLNVTEPNSEKVLPAGVTKPVTMEDGHLDVEQVRLENGEQEERQKQATQKEKEEKAAVVIQTRARAALSRKQYLRTMVAEEDFVGQEEGDLSFLEGELIVGETTSLAVAHHAH
eukprot:COSAG05_NODE_3444_length_2059_cov_2.601020_2_plen_500_part_00